MPLTLGEPTRPAGPRAVRPAIYVLDSILLQMLLTVMYRSACPRSRCPPHLVHMFAAHPAVRQLTASFCLRRSAHLELHKLHYQETANVDVSMYTIASRQLTVT